MTRLMKVTQSIIFLSVTLTALVAKKNLGAEELPPPPGQSSAIVAEYRIPVGQAKKTDFDTKAGLIGKLTKFLIPGRQKPSEVLDLLPEPPSKFLSIAMKINDKSIFTPQANDKKSVQLGFRRNDILPVYDPVKLERGKKTYHHSFKLRSKLDVRHNYLLASVEDPKLGIHIYDIVYGTEFRQDNTEHKIDNLATTIRARDINQKMVGVPIELGINHIVNFAVEVDWELGTVQVFQSEGDAPLVPKGKSESDKKVLSSRGQGEWHIQTLCMPLPDPADKTEVRNDVAHHGIQTKGLKEEVVHLRNFVEDTTKSPVTLIPEGPAVAITPLAVKGQSFIRGKKPKS